METLLKFFPFMPAPKETGKFILALAFYLIVPPIVSFIIGAILGLTIILAPVGVLVGFVLGIYGLAGTVFAILKFAGVDLTGSKKEEV